MINKVEQKKTPYLKAYEKYLKEHTAAFDVPMFLDIIKGISVLILIRFLHT